MDTLRGYSGWGGCADAFSDKPEWRTIRDAIEQALTPEEYTQARASTLTAYYTPGPVVKAMWDALRIGPTPIQVLEIILPSLIQRTGIIKKCAFAV